MAELLGKSIVTTNKRITLPREVAEYLGISIGDAIGFEKKDDGDVYLVKFILQRVERTATKKE